MPIDPRIILSIQPPTPMETPEQAAVAQLTLEQARAKRQQTIDAATDARDLQEALRSNQGPDGIPNFDAAIRALGHNPRAQGQLIEQTQKMRQLQQADRKATLENETKEAEYVAHLAQGLTPENYATALPLLPPQMQQILGPTFDPKKRDFLVATGTGTKEFNDKASAALDHYLKGDWDKAIAEQLAVQPGARDHVLQDARENWNAPPEVIGQWLMVPQEQLQAVAKQKALGVKESATLEGQAEDRELRRDAEARQESHAKATEAIARGQLAVSQGQLDVARQRVAAAKAGAGKTGTRPVTSGDANRITEMRNSLRDLDALRVALTETKDATGTVAGVEAALPNFVTNATGIGVAAKSRQAVIDRVKQVIGKALEGGVLRKEDENKYLKILPVIGDNNQVAAAKLDGLEAAITRKLDEHLSSLEDAGYNTANFRARQASAPSAQTSTAAPANVQAALKAAKPGKYTLSNGKTYQKAPDGTITEVR